MKQESEALQQEDKENKVTSLSYIESYTELDKQNEAEYKLESNESSDDGVIMVDEKEKLDINDDTQMETTIENDKAKVESSVENTTKTIGTDNEEPKRIILNISFHDAEDADYVHKLVNN